MLPASIDLADDDDVRRGRRGAAGFGFGLIVGTMITLPLMVFVFVETFGGTSGRIITDFFPSIAVLRAARLPHWACVAGMLVQLPLECGVIGWAIARRQIAWVLPVLAMHSAMANLFAAR